MGSTVVDFHGPDLLYPPFRHLSCFLHILRRQVPSWVPKPLGKYYLYFAHHRGSYIRLAYADNIAGECPARLCLSAESAGVAENPLHSLLHFATDPDPAPGPYTIYAPGVLDMSLGPGGDHIASPDVLIDEENKVPRPYHHYSKAHSAC